MKCLVTGGAGFIGSHLVDKLIEQGHHVIVLDNLSTGQKNFINPEAGFIEGDILDPDKLSHALEGVDMVFHFAANADVRGGITNTSVDLEQNLHGTKTVLDAMRKANVNKIAFASSATIYGEPETFPTPEGYGPLVQTSTYGASKLASEAYIQAYCEYFNFQSWHFRFVSWIGERYSHGVIFDFVKKLKTDPTQLIILGDGTQKKSYLYVKDGINAILHAIYYLTDQVNLVNLGHTEYIDVKNVADTIIDELGMADVQYHYTGGKRGWKGDSPFVHLDVTKLQNTGWCPQTGIEEGIRRTVRYLQANPQLLRLR